MLQFKEKTKKKRPQGWKSNIVFFPGWDISGEPEWYRNKYPEHLWYRVTCIRWKERDFNWFRPESSGKLWKRLYVLVFYEITLKGSSPTWWRLLPLIPVWFCVCSVPLSVSVFFLCYLFLPDLYVIFYFSLLPILTNTPLQKRYCISMGSSWSNCPLLKDFHLKCIVL